MGILVVVFYLLLFAAIAVLVVLAIVALVLSIRLLRVRLAEATGPRPLDGIDDPRLGRGAHDPDEPTDPDEPKDPDEPAGGRTA